LWFLERWYFLEEEATLGQWFRRIAIVKQLKCAQDEETDVVEETTQVVS
jgi:hypothetical protein